ncbi:MAG: hypothetical protein J6D10_09365 [Clostridia bacterium]|nr:hypothetical protein [Clostridia bacterium]
MDYNLMKNNKVFIAGEVVSEPKFSHEVYNENFFEFDLKVTRLSDSFDVIPVTVSEKLLIGNDIKVGISPMILYWKSYAKSRNRHGTELR